MNFWVVSVLMLVAGLFGWACRELRLRNHESVSRRPAKENIDQPVEVVAAVAEASEPAKDAEIEALKSELARVRQELQQARASAPVRELASDEGGREPKATEVIASASRVPPLPRRVARSVSEDERRLAAAQDQARFAAIQLAASRSEVQQLQARLKQANEVIRRKTELLRQSELKLGTSRMGSSRPGWSPKRSEPTRPPLFPPHPPRDAEDAPQVTQLRREVEQRSSHLKEAQKDTEQAQLRARELEQRLERVQLESQTRAERIEALLEEVGELRQRLGSLLPEPATAPILFDAPTQGVPDELKRLHGVGPKVQQLLNQLGVYYFWQIAEWQPEHVRYVEQQLPQLRGRIERDEWCQQAAALADADSDAATASGTVTIAATGGRAGAASRASTEAKGRC